MPVDETIRLKTEAQEQASIPEANFIFFNPPVYNIDDMDSGAFMMDHRMEGVYIILSKTPVNPKHPGKVFVNGVFSSDALIHSSPISDGSLIGLPVRRHLRQYGAAYQILYSGAVSQSGKALPDFAFELKTLPKIKPGNTYPEHDKLVLDAAREGIVLLKNADHVLPLGKNAVVNAFGKGAATFRLGCVGAGKINPRYGIRFEEGIQTYSSMHLNEELFEFYRSTESNLYPDSAMIQNARKLSDTAVVVITRGTGESQDNRPVAGDYELTEEEKNLLAHVFADFKKTVVILNTGYPISMDWLRVWPVHALIWCGLPGMAGGRALAEILEGTVCPSGRLPDTWSYKYDDIPSSKNFFTPENVPFSSEETSFVNTVYEEGLYIGYRYFETFHKPCAFPFGHGLSYTEFSIDLVRSHIYGLAIALQLRVTNTGNMSGKNSVLVFAGLPDGRLEQPSRRLVAFGKTRELAPGASETLDFFINESQLKSYDETTASWIIEPGTLRFYIGGSVSDARYAASMAVTSEFVVYTVQNRLNPPFKIVELSKNNPDETWPSGNLSGYVTSHKLPYALERTVTVEKHPVTSPIDHLITFPMVIKDRTLIDAFVAQLNDYELCRMSIGGRTGWGPDDNGFAGTLYTGGALEKYHLPDYFMADGNNGLNLNIATIGFPVSNTMCATFNEELSYLEGRALATEAIDMNLQCILAPAMNLHRNPLCGRHSEYFSEDPYLAGRMGGMESRGIESMGISSVMKHLFANNAENYRNRNHSLMTERTARELYLKVFEVAMDVHMPDAVMTGYNPANGCWCAGDEDLLQGILRGEWNFQGYVMTDWGSSACCSAAASAQAGNSWIAPGEMDDSEVLPMLEAIANGHLDKKRLQRNVRNMYAVIAKYMRPED